MPHTRGASHSASRVIRLLGDENLAVLEFSYAEWRTLERQTGDELLVQAGLINVGPKGDEYLAKCMAIVKAGGYDVEWLDADELRRRHPAVRYAATRAWARAATRAAPSCSRTSVSPHIMCQS